MWLFIAQEVMFFGGLFLAYTVYRNLYPAAFAEASHHLDWKLGGINTAVLILSSLTMALAVRAAALGHRKQIVLFLILTVVLGSVFLGVKVVEYGDKFEHHLVPGAHFQFPGPNARPAQIFYSLYFAMTGLHALHMIIGIPILLILAWLAHRGRYGPGVPHAGGDDRAVLALRGHRVDLPVSAALSGWASLMSGAAAHRTGTGT